MGERKSERQKGNSEPLLIAVILKMVYFVCNRCQETIRKVKVDEHSKRCGSNSFSCVDCGKDFSLTAARNHNTCITEEEKYQGKLYNAGKVRDIWFM